MAAVVNEGGRDLQRPSGMILYRTTQSVAQQRGVPWAMQRG